MRIFLANESKQAIGGGWTFLRNFSKSAAKKGITVQEAADQTIENSRGEILFIAGATMVTRDRVKRAKECGMKIVLRVDNAPKNSRNRNTGTSRLKDFADMADLVVYQSAFAKRYLSPFLQKDGPIIINGADHEIFTPEGSRQPKEGQKQFLFSQFNRDETKRWHEAWYSFSREHTKRKGNCHLWIIGNFSPENVEYNFDFFMGEKFRYVGVLDNPMDFAEYLRSTDKILIPYYNDACSNTLIEARLCRVKQIAHGNTGGNQDIMDAKYEHLTADYMTQRYLEEFEKIL